MNVSFYHNYLLFCCLIFGNALNGMYLDGPVDDLRDLSTEEHCLPPGYNDAVGTLDMLMLKHAQIIKGKKCVEQEILRHTFSREIALKNARTQYVRLANPYCLSYECKKNDKSVLSTTVFEIVKLAERAEMLPFTSNTINMRSQLRLIDHCTSYERKTKSSSHTITVSAYFYDKIALLRALERDK